jgi:hypothetical protein
MFVTTADPKLEPAVVTVNTVLSLLALDYPAGKLSCYVSDDGCSAVTCYALREAAEFAKLWVPFTRKHGAKVRAPFAYFSSSSGGGAAERGGGGGVGAADADAEFLRAWTSMKVTASAGRTMHTHVPAVSSDRVLARTRVVCRTSTRSWSAGSRAPRRGL